MRLATTLALALCVALPAPIAANAAGDQPRAIDAGKPSAFDVCFR